MYQQLQKICKEKVGCIKVFRASLGKFGQNILCTLKKLPGPTPMLSDAANNAYYLYLTSLVCLVQ